jgi:asparagine synthase (glutamine-hydrolysing)
MIYRRKVGFGVPVGAWLRQPTGLGRFLDVLTDATFKGRGFADAAGVADVVARHRRGERDYGDVLWGLVNLELWCRSTIDGAGGATEAL